MVVIPAGNFVMGSPDSEPGRDDAEGPRHAVTIARPFAIGKFEVTFGEFRKFVADTGYAVAQNCWDDLEFFPNHRRTDRDPVLCVSWNDAHAYADWLSSRTGKRYRLLSEAEWEYAARAGTQTTYPWGDQAACSRVVNARLCDKAVSSTAPVGSFAANRFGLHDMIGNAWEWVEDCFSYSGGYAAAPEDGSAVEGDCTMRVLRGGAWDSNWGQLRSAARNWARADGRGSVYGYGFRIAMSL